MSARRKKHAAPKRGPVWHQSAEEATLARKPYINGFACGHGVHGDTKYNRARAKSEWMRRMADEGASRGSFPLGVDREGAAFRFCDNGLREGYPLDISICVLNEEMY